MILCAYIVSLQLFLVGDSIEIEYDGLLRCFYVSIQIVFSVLTQKFSNLFCFYSERQITPCFCAIDVVNEANRQLRFRIAVAIGARRPRGCLPAENSSLSYFVCLD